MREALMNNKATEQLLQYNISDAVRVRGNLNADKKQIGEQCHSGEV